VAAAADKQQDVRPEAAAAAVASTAAEDASGEGRGALAAEPAGPQPDSQAPDGDVVAVKGLVPSVVCTAGFSLLRMHPSMQYVLLIHTACFSPLPNVKQMGVADHGGKGRQGWLKFIAKISSSNYLSADPKQHAVAFPLLILFTKQAWLR